MKEQLELKIAKLQGMLENQCFMYATDFDKSISEDLSVKDAIGRKWNHFLHKMCLEYGFEIWKHEERNVYVKNTEECKQKAKSEGFLPWTTSTLIRNVAREN